MLKYLAALQKTTQTPVALAPIIYFPPLLNSIETGVNCVLRVPWQVTWASQPVLSWYPAGTGAVECVAGSGDADCSWGKCKMAANSRHLVYLFIFSFYVSWEKIVPSPTSEQSPALIKGYAGYLGLDLALIWKFSYISDLSELMHFLRLVSKTMALNIYFHR